MRIALRFLPAFVWAAARWVEWQERRILKDGVPLYDESMMDAVKMGVASPEKIRLLRVDRIPMLNGAFIRQLARCFPAISTHTVGLTLGYGIYVRAKWWGDRHLIAHECVHVGQYERCGSAAAFLKNYFTECIEDGYPAAPMEQEAILRSASLDA